MIIHQRCGFLCLHFKAASPFVKHAETNEWSAARTSVPPFQTEDAAAIVLECTSIVLIPIHHRRFLDERFAVHTIPPKMSTDVLTAVICLSSIHPSCSRTKWDKRGRLQRRAINFRTNLFLLCLRGTIDVLGRDGDKTLSRGSAERIKRARPSHLSETRLSFLTANE